MLTKKIETYAPYFGATLVLIGIVSGSSIIIKDKNKDIKPDVIVGYSMDPDVTNDGPFQLGYPGHRMMITCDKTSNTCMLDVEEKDKHDTKMFDFVYQEWFTPTGNNRPYHSLDVIKSLPSYNGNPKLMLGANIDSNTKVVNILKNMGWVK